MYMPQALPFDTIKKEYPIMEIILLLILLITQMNGKNGKPALDFSKLTPLMSLLGDKPISEIPALKNLNLSSILPENMNISEIMNAVSAFSSFAAPKQEQETAASAQSSMSPLRPISKIADANITYALNQYFSE